MLLLCITYTLPGVEISEQFSPVGDSPSVATKERDEPRRLTEKIGLRLAQGVHAYHLPLWCFPQSHQEASDGAVVEA